MDLAWFSLGVVVLMLGTVVGLCLADLRRRRPDAPPDAFQISFLIPCYNDADTVPGTVESILASGFRGRMEIWVADDASTDGSGEALEALVKSHGIRLIRHPRNLGKTEVMNRLAREASGDILICLDADTRIHARALRDLLARFAFDPRVGAVSCPYHPSSHRFLARMQAIEYSMISMVQGSYNLTSVLGLWGGCLAVRRDVFLEVGGFTRSAITEDVDLAFKVTAAGRRVEQSFVSVPTEVPVNLRSWVRQKIRWTSGGFQCLVRHPKVWMKNPLYLIMITGYSFLAVTSSFRVIAQTIAMDRWVDTLLDLRLFLPWVDSVRLAARIHDVHITESLAVASLFSLLSVVYVIPLISRTEDLVKILLVVPFALAYFPMYALVSLAGIGFFLFRAARGLRGESRAW